MAKPKSARKSAPDVKALLAALPVMRFPALEFEAGADDVGAVVDRLGRIAALKGEVKRYEEGLKKIVIDNGEPIVEGKLFRAVITGGGLKEGLDIEAIREDMDEKWLTKYTVRSRTSKSVRVNARKGTDAQQAAA